MWYLKILYEEIEQKNYKYSIEQKIFFAFFIAFLHTKLIHIYRAFRKKYGNAMSIVRDKGKNGKTKAWNNG